MLHFFNTIDNCDGFGRKTVETLVSNNIKSVEQIYKMSANDFENLGFGSGISANLEKALEDSKNNLVEDWRLMAAFGIKNLGRGDSKKLLKHFDIHEIYKVTAEDIIAIEGFGQKTSLSIANEIQNKWPTMNFILDLGFNIEYSKKLDTNSVFSGKNILFTGSMTVLNNDGKPYKRPEMEKMVENLGANVQKQINSKTDILVYGEKAGSKLKKAQGMKGVAIYTEQEFWDVFGSEL